MFLYSWKFSLGTRTKRVEFHLLPSGIFRKRFVTNHCQFSRGFQSLITGTLKDGKMKKKKQADINRLIGLLKSKILFDLFFRSLQNTNILSGLQEQKHLEKKKHLVCQAQLKRYIHIIIFLIIIIIIIIMTEIQKVCMLGSARILRKVLSV